MHRLKQLQLPSGPVQFTCTSLSLGSVVTVHLVGPCPSPRSLNSLYVLNVPPLGPYVLPPSIVAEHPSKNCTWRSAKSFAPPGFSTIQLASGPVLAVPSGAEKSAETASPVLRFVMAAWPVVGLVLVISNNNVSSTLGLYPSKKTAGAGKNSYQHWVYRS